MKHESIYRLKLNCISDTWRAAFLIRSCKSNRKMTLRKHLLVSQWIYLKWMPLNKQWIWWTSIKTFSHYRLWTLMVCHKTYKIKLTFRAIRISKIKARITIRMYLMHNHIFQISFKIVSRFKVNSLFTIKAIYRTSLQNTMGISLISFKIKTIN